MGDSIAERLSLSHEACVPKSVPIAPGQLLCKRYRLADNSTYAPTPVTQPNHLPSSYIAVPAPANPLWPRVEGGSYGRIRSRIRPLPRLPLLTPKLQRIYSFSDARALLNTQFDGAPEVNAAVPAGDSRFLGVSEEAGEGVRRKAQFLVRVVGERHLAKQAGHHLGRRGRLYGVAGRIFGKRRRIDGRGPGWVGKDPVYVGDGAQQVVLVFGPPPSRRR
jgi:hypothetical protein